MEKEIDLLFELECAEEYLSSDIQSLFYILDDINNQEEKYLAYAIEEIKNNIETLARAMIYNDEQMKKAIDKVYKKKKGE